MARSGGVLYLGTDSPTGLLYAFDTETGKALWKHPAGRGVSADVLLLGRRLHALSLDGVLTAHDAGSGEVRWRHQGQPAPERDSNRSPALAEGFGAAGRLFVADPDGTLAAVDGETGEVAWVQTLPAPAATDVVWTAGAVYAASQDGTLLRLDPATGAITARLGLPGQPGRTLVAAGGTLLLYVVDAQNGGIALTAVAADLSRVLWQRQGADGAHWSTLRPHIRDETVVVGDEWGLVSALSLTDGKVLWSVEVEETAKSVSSGQGDGGEDLLAVGTEEGTLVLFRLPK